MLEERVEVLESQVVKLIAAFQRLKAANATLGRDGQQLQEALQARQREVECLQHERVVIRQKLEQMLALIERLEVCANGERRARANQSKAVGR